MASIFAGILSLLKKTRLVLKVYNSAFSDKTIVKILFFSDTPAGFSIAVLLVSYARIIAEK